MPLESHYMFLNGPPSASISVFFKQTTQNLQQINVKKCPSCIQRRDSK